MMTRRLLAAALALGATMFPAFAGARSFDVGHVHVTTTDAPKRLDMAVTVPATIRVLPNPNSLIGIPNPIATRPANRKPIPATNNRTTIEFTPQPAPEMLASRHRHNTVILCIPPTGIYGCGSV